MKLRLGRCLRLFRGVGRSSLLYICIFASEGVSIISESVATSSSNGQFAIGGNNQSLVGVPILLDQMRLYILRNF